ncbi:hypothetical protein [Xanthomarina sp. F2636L]|uniref:hypothetical protein n=1 Tax=Xanthomarina sp. F2636L TaxID=2996018 RepID=UPI00225E0A29|nr:hypothetical protein [Xanthomarina sp. F2636L]MCX7550820.1 hypothetical protein [Xanthomarina sp. F2636L]
MKTKLNQDLESEIKQTKKKYLTSQGLLNSNYKRVVNHSFQKACKKSVFGARLSYTSPKLCKLSHAATMVLKISIFASATLVVLL